MTYSSAFLRLIVSFGITGCFGVSGFLASEDFTEVSALLDETSALVKEKLEKVGEMEVKGNALMVGEGVSSIMLAKVGGEAANMEGVVGREGGPMPPNRLVFG